MSRFSTQFVAAYRIPVALNLLGKHVEADAFVHDELAKLETRTDPAAERYRVFASHFNERQRYSSRELE